MSRPRWTLLLDGAPVDGFSDRDIVFDAARGISRDCPRVAVAVCRLGRPLTLTRFCNGAPLDPSRSPR